MTTISRISQTNIGLKSYTKAARQHLCNNQKVVNYLSPKVKTGKEIALKFLEHFANGLEVMFNAIHVK